jgi:hypothetical protein
LCMKKNVMVDLETLGKRAGCAILSIGAVRFDAEGVDMEDGLYLIVRRKDCVDAGLHEDPSTVEWWEKQSDTARKVIHLSERDDATPLRTALTEFGAFVGSAKVYGNGSDFDNAILYAAYAALGMDVPWKFWDSRCYRTLKGLFPDVKMVRGGTHHNAFDDAVSQARHASEIMRSKGLV